MRQPKFEKILDYLLIAAIFTSGLHLKLDTGVLYLAYIYYVIYTFYYLSVGKRIYYNAKILYVFLCATIYSIALYILFHANLIKGLAAISIFLLLLISYYTLLVNHGVQLVFQMYLKVALFFSGFAIIQEILLLGGVPQEYLAMEAIFKDLNGFWGVPALSAEPAEFAIVVVPAFYYALDKTIFSGGSYKTTLILLISLVISTSSLGILGVVLACSLIFVRAIDLRDSKIIFFIPLFLAVVIYLLSQEYFVMRFNDWVYLFSSSRYHDYKGYNLSSYSQAVNYGITVRSLENHFFLGPGFAMYSAIFDQYSAAYVTPSHRDSIPGRGTATSLLLRVTAEFGLPGLFLMMFFLIYYFNRKDALGISNACFIFLALAYLRMGIYFANGLVFFLLVYYANDKRLIFERRTAT